MAGIETSLICQRRNYAGFMRISWIFAGKWTVFLRIDGESGGKCEGFRGSYAGLEWSLAVVLVAIGACICRFSAESQQSRKKAVVFFFFYSLKMIVGGRRPSGSFAHLDIRTWLLVCLLLPSPTGWDEYNFQEDLVL